MESYQRTRLWTCDWYKRPHTATSNTNACQSEGGCVLLSGKMLADVIFRAVLSRTISSTNQTLVHMQMSLISQWKWGRKGRLLAALVSLALQIFTSPWNHTPVLLALEATVNPLKERECESCDKASFHIVSPLFDSTKMSVSAVRFRLFLYPVTVAAASNLHLYRRSTLSGVPAQLLQELRCHIKGWGSVGLLLFLMRNTWNTCWWNHAVL